MWDDGEGDVGSGHCGEYCAVGDGQSEEEGSIDGEDINWSVRMSMRSNRRFVCPESSLAIISEH